MSIAPDSPEKYFRRHVIEDDNGHGWLDYRLGTGGTAELTNIEVSNEHRREGVGRLLLARMVAELPLDVKTVYAWTSAQNRIAHEWYDAMEFTRMLVPGFYKSMGEDAYLCVKNIR